MDIHKLISAISPDLYCDASVRSKVKKIAKEKGYSEAAKDAKLVEVIEINTDKEKINPLNAKGTKAPFERHKLIYDAASQGLEPLYFWILDYASGNFSSVEKVIDNFTSSPGSGHFSELGSKATQMQQQATKMLGDINTVLKSILNIIYDLKEFKIRLETYDDFHSKDKNKRDYALLSLKQIWMDRVDVQRGNGSLNAMAQQLDFVTIRDAFMAANSVDDVKKLDLNDRVKRILIARVGEFIKWVDHSEKELRKRFEIEKTYLKSQLNSLKLYSRWLKPYLHAARKLEQASIDEPSLVTVFNTIIMELTLLAKNEFSPTAAIAIGDLPKMFSSVTKKKFHSVMVIDFKFRGIPQRTGQHYAFGGKAEVTFTAYGLTDAELETLKKEMEKDDVFEALHLIEGITSDSLEQIKADIDEFVEDKSSKVQKPKEESTDVNPFSALFSIFKTSEKKDAKKENKITPDSSHEKVLRSMAIIEAREKCTKIFKEYKKAHNMPNK